MDDLETEVKKTIQPSFPNLIIKKFIQPTFAEITWYMGEFLIIGTALGLTGYERGASIYEMAFLAIAAPLLHYHIARATEFYHHLGRTIKVPESEETLPKPKKIKDKYEIKKDFDLWESDGKS